MKYLTRKQVLALSRAMKRTGRKLPSVGYCAIFSRPSASFPGTRTKTVEVCHDYSPTQKKHLYYMVGQVDSYAKAARRREKFRR